MFHGFIQINKGADAKSAWRQVREQVEWGLRLMVSPSEYEVYELFREGRSAADALRYLSEARKHVLTGLSTEPERLENKLNFERELAAQGVPVVRTRALYSVSRGGPKTIHGEQCRKRLGDHLVAALEAGEEIVLKPADGMQGMGVRVLTAVDQHNGQISVTMSNGQRQGLEDLLDYVDSHGGQWLVQDRVEQDAQMSRFNPTTLNAIRVVTFLRRDGAVDIDLALARFGMPGAQTDLPATGAVVVRVDTETGTLEAVGHRRPGHTPRRLTVHPVSKRPYAKEVIEGWDSVVELVTRAAQVAAPNVYIGWDVVKTSEGPKILEGNHDSSLKFLQTGPRGVLTDWFVERLAHEYGTTVTIHEKPPLRPLTALRTLILGGIRSTRSAVRQWETIATSTRP